MVGESLRAAVRAYQERNQMTPDGYASLALFNRIESEPSVDPVPRADLEPHRDRGQCQ